MNVLVSDTTKVYDDWIVVRALKDVSSIVGNIDYLVYHKSNELSETKIKYLSDIYKSQTGCKIIYICKKESADNAIRMLVTGGLKGKYIDDEFFLESNKELNTLITNLSTIVENTELSSTTVLNDFFNRYISEGNTGISRGYLQVVKNAAIEMSDSYHRKSLEMLKMSESAAEIFSNSVSIIEQIKAQKESLEDDLRTLKNKASEANAIRQVQSTSVVFYPRISYLKNKRVIRIKDICHSSYAVSFVMGFREYLDKIKGLKPKLVIIEPNGTIFQDRYKEFNWVTTGNKNDLRNFYGNVVFTNTPTTLIMNRLFDDTEFDTIVALDRTVNYRDNIINCKGDCFYIVNGKASVKNLNLGKLKFLSVAKEVEGSIGTIPFFNDYPRREDQRINKYLKECSTIYELLTIQKKK